jgi:curved DNA-binding protein CbpA
LDLEPGASAEEIKRAYRELVKVWHPDRFAYDSRLQKKAEEKLKKINGAYEQLQSIGFSYQDTGPRPNPEPQESTAEEPTSKASSFNDTIAKFQEKFSQLPTTWRVALIVILLLALSRLLPEDRPSNSPGKKQSV